MTTATSEENVRKRAFEFFQERGAVHGDDKADWLKAESELRDSKRSVKPSPRRNGNTPAFNSDKW